MQKNKKSNNKSGIKAPGSFDFFGNVVVVNFPEEMKLKEKKEFAKELMQKNKSIKTVLEKSGKIKGRLRKPETKYIAGEKTKEVLYRENGCVFRFNIDTTYFSPRLSNERKEISNQVKKNEKVLVMFAGVAPFSIVIAKNSQAKKVVSNEINREANKYAKLNVELNKLNDKIDLVQGDIKRLVRTGKINNCVEFSSEANKKIDFHGQKGRLSEGNSRCPRFDVIVMPRPQLKDSFLDEAFALSKKGTRIYYYDFCKIDEVNEIVKKVKEKATQNKKKIKILNTKKAGELAPYKIRVRIDFKVL